MSFHVTMTDNFMSGWGMAEGKINKLVIHCDNVEQARQIEAHALTRNDMSSVHVAEGKPTAYSEKDYFVSERTYQSVGGAWIEDGGRIR